MYPDKQISPELSFDCRELIPFDREDMMELLGNLLDNACKWARHEILVQIICNSTLRITIEDDGPGINEQDIGKLTTRGRRLDEHTPGHGLGLSIVADIIQHYRGELHFTRRLDGNDGLRVEIKLPLEQYSNCSQR